MTMWYVERWLNPFFWIVFILYFSLHFSLALISQDKLLTVTIAPIAIFALLGIVFGFHLLHTITTLAKENPSKTRDELLQEAKNKLTPRYVGLFLVITYLVLPSVSTIIFGTFNLVNVDPQNLAPGTPLYLRNDYSITNNSKRFLLGLGYAIAMIFVYPIAVPVIYFVFLWANRSYIKKSKPVSNLQPLPENVKIVLEYEKDDAVTATFNKVKKSYEQFKGRISLWVDFKGDSHQVLDFLPTATKAPKVDQEGRDFGDGVQAAMAVTLEPSETNVVTRGNLQYDGAPAVSMVTRDNNTPCVPCPEQCDDETECDARCFSGSFLQLITQEIGFLFRAYEGDFWYWEIVETARRLLLTAVVSVAGPGTVSQIIFGIFLSLAFAGLYAHCRPFEDKNLDWLQEISQYQVFFTLFISLLIRTSTWVPYFIFLFLLSHCDLLSSCSNRVEPCRYLPCLSTYTDALNDGVNDAFYLMALDGALIAANTLTPVALIVIQLVDWKQTNSKWSSMFASCSSQNPCCACGKCEDPSPVVDKEDLPPSNHSMASWGVNGPLPENWYDLEEGAGTTAVHTSTVDDVPRNDQFELSSFHRTPLLPPPSSSSSSSSSSSETTPMAGQERKVIMV